MIQFSVTLPLECHSDQSSVNGYDLMIIHVTGLQLCQFSFTLPLDYHSNHWNVTGIRSSIMIFVKNTPVAEIQDRKGTPFEYFLRVLSTNQRAGFGALDQSEASISARFFASVNFEAIQSTATLPLECHSDHSCATETDPVPLRPKSRPMRPIDCHFAT